MNEKEIIQLITEELKPLFKTIFDKFDGIDERFDGIDERFDNMAVDVKDIKKDLKDTKVRVENIEEDLKNTKKDVHNINLSIENKIWPTIQEIKNSHAQYVKETQELREDMQWLKDSVEENTALIGAVAKEAGIVLAERI